VTNCEVEDLRQQLISESFPRLQMSIVVGLSGIGAFLVSASLLWAGLTNMPLRYFLATAAGYAVFLSLIRAWLSYQRRRWSIDLDVPTELPLGGHSEPPSFSGAGGTFGGAGSTGSLEDASAIGTPRVPASHWLPRIGPTEGGSTVDGLSDFDADGPVALGVVLLLAGLVALGAIVYVSPTLFAEVLLDAAVVSAAYRRARRREQQHWLKGVVRRTWLPVALLCALVALGAFVLQASAPEARSLGDVFRPQAQR
jgi:hypothetical protein